MTAMPRAVGAGLARLDIREKVEGRAQYIADLYRPGMLHGALLGSPHAHARIKSYDIREALAVPGVHAVLTGDDFGEHRMGAFIKDEHAIAKGKVRYVGEPVAAVAAETEAAAKLAARLVQVEYEELPAILSPEDALKPGAAIIHEELASYFKVFDTGSERNICSRTSLVEGDAAAWKECDVVVEGSFTTVPQAHVSLEPCGALAETDPSGRITLWSANQSVFRVQANVCESLGLPMAQLRSLTPRIGAGFGNKMEPHIQPIAVKLAMATGRPVKLILTREEDFEIVRARHPFKIKAKTGAKRDGTLIDYRLRLHGIPVRWQSRIESWRPSRAFVDLQTRGPYRLWHHTHEFEAVEGGTVMRDRVRYQLPFGALGDLAASWMVKRDLERIFEYRRMRIAELLP